MKKVLLITAILTVIVATFTFLEVNKYDKNKKVDMQEKEIEKIKKDIIDIDEKIENANKKIDEISKNNIDKVENLKLWQKQLEKLQKSL